MQQTKIEFRFHLVNPLEECTIIMHIPASLLLWNKTFDQNENAC